MKKNYFLDEKLEYEDIEVPDELLLLVRQTVAADRRKKAVKRRNHIISVIGSIAALFIICLGIGVNSSFTVAKTAVKIPVVNSVAKAMIVRSYKAEAITAAAEELQQKKQNSKKENVLPEEEPAVDSISGNENKSESESENESENNTLTGEPEAPVTEETATPILNFIDSWKAELTLEELNKITEVYTPDMEERYADSPEKLRTVLLAKLPEKNIYLYGYHENGEVKGVALRVNDAYKFFDWVYMNESKKLPEIYSMDVDGDSTEELFILLYNEKIRMTEIGKESIPAPENFAQEENALGETAAKPETEPSGSAEPLPKSEASENDADLPEKTEDASPQTGELWLVSFQGDDWTANVLSANDYESQILHQLKAEYDEAAKTIQFYLMEEPFGKPVPIPDGENAGFSLEALKIAAGKKFVIKDSISLWFKLDAVFVNEAGEKKTVGLEPEWKADISIEDNSFVLGNIKMQEMKTMEDVSGTDVPEGTEKTPAEITNNKQ